MKVQQRVIGWLVLAFTFVVMASMGFLFADFVPTEFVYLPLVAKQSTPTPTPTATPIPDCRLYVQNDTGGELCYEVEGTGLGEKCYSSGIHHYGNFPPGSYRWRVSARCGSDSGTKNYSSSTYTHRFWCAGRAASYPSSSGLRSLD